MRMKPLTETFTVIASVVEDSFAQPVAVRRTRTDRTS